VGLIQVEQHLLGRVAEIEILDGLVQGLPECGGALVVRGEAGIGKSALLDVARRTAAARGFSVLETGGVQSEAHLAFAGLHQLLRPALGRLDRLPVRQREAVEAAFGLGDSAAADTFLIALGTLDLLAEMAADAPLLLIVEDAQWLDTATCDVLAFVARRVELEPIVILFAVRDGFDRRVGDAGLQDVRLAGLDEDSAAALLDVTAPDLAPDLRRRVLVEAAGNPLGLVELPRGLRADGSDTPALPVPLPLTERLERAFAARASELPAPARGPLLVAALDLDGDLRHVLEAASELTRRSVGVADFVDAVAADLVALDESRVRFRHPLIRSAIYQDAPLVERHAAHSALARAYADDPDRSVWHRAASLVAPDDTVVDELEEAAARARRRGAPAGAAAALQRAADMASDSARRGALLLQAAELEYEIGRHDVALRVLREARTLELDERARVRLAFLLEVLESGWSGTEKVPAFVEIAEELRAAGETTQALDALMTVSVRCWWGRPEQAMRDRVVAVAERLGMTEDEPALIAILALADPVNRGRFVLERLSRARDVDGGDPVAMFLLGSAATSVWAHNLSLAFHAAAVDGLRAQGRLALLAQALVSQAWAAVHMADARVATPAAAEGARLSDETGQPRWAAAAMLAQATMAAERGDAAGAEELTGGAERVLLPMGANPMLSVVQFARGRAAIAQGRFSDAYEQLRRIFDPADIAHQPFIGGWAIADFVDAAAHGGGSLDAARETLAEYERVAALTDAPLLRAQVTYVRPLLASAGDAEALFQTALEDGELSSWRCYRGRLLLAYGAWLRRQRRAAESRVPLRVAAQAFDALGFVGMSERARQELRASGEASRPRAPEAWDQLSPQELQIARMAAAGMTNRQIGEKLYLSHRTIGSHLYRIFPKLGITSRAELRDGLEGAVRV
jgi:DNA-binding CsgD family transcriptional regulator